MRQLQEMQLSLSHIPIQKNASCEHDIINKAMDSLIAIPCKDKFWKQNAKSAEKYLKHSLPPTKQLLVRHSLSVPVHDKFILYKCTHVGTFANWVMGWSSDRAKD
jgi:hypothetical protein